MNEALLILQFTGTSDAQTVGSRFQFCQRSPHIWDERARATRIARRTHRARARECGHVHRRAPHAGAPGRAQ